MSTYHRFRLFSLVYTSGNGVVARQRLRLYYITVERLTSVLIHILISIEIYIEPQQNKFKESNF